MKAMYKIAVIGSRQTVIGFKALGLDVFPAATGEQARKQLKELTRPEQPDEYAIIYIEENLAAEIQSDIDKFKDSPSPAVILIPGRDGTLGLGQTALHAAVERAVGSDILKEQGRR